MPTSNPMTVQQLLAKLRPGHCKLPTLVVEGPDDTRIYRWVKEALGFKPTKINLLPTGGRSKLLKVYEAVDKNRNHFASVPIIFIADQDMFVFGNIPPKYSDIVFTTGYSIENDLYLSGNLEVLLDPPKEDREHAATLNVIIEWFAFEVEEHLAGRPSCVARDLKDIVRSGTTCMDPSFRKSRKFNPPRPFFPPDPNIHSKIKNNYKLMIRGKTLFDVLVRFLDDDNRKPRHSRKGLQETAFKISTNPCLKNKLIKNIRKKIDDEDKRIAAFA